MITMNSNTHIMIQKLTKDEKRVLRMALDYYLTECRRMRLEESPALSDRTWLATCEGIAAQLLKRNFVR